DDRPTMGGSDGGLADAGRRIPDPQIAVLGSADDVRSGPRNGPDPVTLAPPPLPQAYARFASGAGIDLAYGVADGQRDTVSSGVERVPVAGLRRRDRFTAGDRPHPNRLVVEAADQDV